MEQIGGAGPRAQLPGGEPQRSQRARLALRKGAAYLLNLSRAPISGALHRDEHHVPPFCSLRRSLWQGPAPLITGVDRAAEAHWHSYEGSFGGSGPTTCSTSVVISQLFFSFGGTVKVLESSPVLMSQDFMVVSTLPVKRD